jgi:stage II sporulation protein D
MRRIAKWMLGLILLAIVSAGQAQDDDGGRDLSVLIFSTQSLHAITLASVGPDAWVAACARCAHKPLTVPVHFNGPAEIFAGGSIRVTDDASHEERTATGLWHLRAMGKGGHVDVVLTLPSERYVAAVLNAEAAPDEPAESLRALAIVARTYALNGPHYTAQPGHLPAALCDSTQCQAMRFGAVPDAVSKAVRATAGETLWFGPKRAEVFFSQSCGGVTEDAGAVWPGLGGLAYLHSHPDPYCARRGSAAWHAEVPLAELAAIARSEGWRLPGRIVAARVSRRGASHRVLEVAFRDADGHESLVAASTLRFGIGRGLGWNRVRSDGYQVGVRNGSLVLDGRGHGHGVGLCQAGATEMAVEGKDHRAILAFYFPGTVVRITPRDAGWHEARMDALRLRAADALTAKELAEAHAAWDEARRRFPPRAPIAPEISFAPTTEVFRQLTGQPGWALASTQGIRIVLQPAAVLRGRGRSTLAHEMLHVLVEAEATERAPLWLREGLVEALAGEPSPPFAMPAADMEAALRHPDSLAASQRAHRAAAARVRAAIARYGASAVRGWLSSGPPPETTPSGA